MYSMELREEKGVGSYAIIKTKNRNLENEELKLDIKFSVLTSFL